MRGDVPGAACYTTSGSAKIFARDHAMGPATVKSGLPDVASQSFRRRGEVWLSSKARVLRYFLPSCKSRQLIGGFFFGKEVKVIRLLMLLYGLLATILFCVLGIGLVAQFRI
jgi:hypothetical protein